jgi:hypothetical protein
VDRREFERVAARMIDTYFRHPSYYTIDGKPVLMIYDLQPHRGLGGVEPDARGARLVPRPRGRSGLPGLHLQACLRRSGPEPHRRRRRGPAAQAEVIGGSASTASHYQFVHFVDIDRDYDAILPTSAEWKRSSRVQHPVLPARLGRVGQQPALPDVPPRRRPRQHPRGRRARLPPRGRTPTRTRTGAAVTVNSWNEWTETSYLQPDDLYGYGYLEAVDGDERYLRITRRLTAALFRTDHSGLAISGGIGRHEGWSEDQHCGDGLGETCASGVTLQFLQELMNTDADLRYGDAMERVLYNQLFAAQEPAGRRLRYFTPATGKRSYWPHDIFCCPGNYRRALSRMPHYLYYRFHDGIAVNLYGASRADVRLADDLVVTIDQVTDYPSTGRIELTIEPSRPSTFPIYLRVPRWCDQPRIVVNGDAAAATIEREWRAGDRVEIDFPMRWRFVRGRDLQAGRASLMRGPTVFTLSRTANELAESVVLRDITLDPASIDGPQRDTTIRPDGQACLVRAWSPGRSTALSPDLELRLTEYPDPDGEEVFFLLPEGAPVEEDELATLAGSGLDKRKEAKA